MKSDPSTGRITISGVRDDVLDRFDDLADAEDKTRSEKVVELMEAEVGSTVPDEGGEYLPTDDRLRTVYEAVLDHAKMPDHTLRFDIHGGQVASSAKMSKKALRGQLFHLQSRGFVRFQQGRDTVQTQRETYRVKPRCANPRTWKYSRIRDPDAVRALDEDAPEEPEADDAEDAGDILDDLDAAGKEVAESAD